MRHPILTATDVVTEALKSVADTNPTFMVPADKAEALRALIRLEGSLSELTLRVLAAADDVAEQSGARDVAGWLVAHCHLRIEDARLRQALAHALDRRYPATARALRDGQATVAQVDVIVRACDALAPEIELDLLSHAEHHLVGYAADFGPRELGRLGRRILDVIAPEIAEATEARHLAALERTATDRTRLTLRRQGDGTTRIAGPLPDTAATRLATYLDAFTNPRRHQDKDGQDGLDEPAPDAGSPSPSPSPPADDPVARLAYPRRLGNAFCHLLESIDPARLPQHAGDATTVIITISLDSLRRDLGTAELLAGDQVPGADPTAGGLTAAQVRRLACNAHLIPAVLGTDSEILDLGRSARLFNRAQHKALLLRDRHCRAEGCDIPGTWTEAHHWQPWSRDGHTDLTNAVLLCRHHHQRIHDTHHEATRLPNGDIRFHRRR